MRVGHHCAWPLHRAIGATATTRASVAVYNTTADVDALVEALDRVPAVFGLDLETGRQLMDLYQELILEHSKRPHHAGLRAPFDAEVHHINPTCGDEVTLRVDRRRRRATRRSCATSPMSHKGCSISVASASVLAEEVIGRPVSEALGPSRRCARC